MHWIDMEAVGEGTSYLRWVLKRRILGSIPVDAKTIDHEGEWISLLPVT